MGHRGEKLAVSGRLFEFGFVSQHLRPDRACPKRRRRSDNCRPRGRRSRRIQGRWRRSQSRGRCRTALRPSPLSTCREEPRVGAKAIARRASTSSRVTTPGAMIEAACRVATAGQDRLLDFAHRERGQIRRHAHGMAENRLQHLEFRDGRRVRRLRSAARPARPRRPRSHSRPDRPDAPARPWRPRR